MLASRWQDQGPIREHGVINRPTEDVDLFTTNQDAGDFGRAVERVLSDLRGSGYQVDLIRRAAQFARLEVRAPSGMRLDVDAIRMSGRFSDEELVQAATERDSGFEIRMFARQLDAVRRLQPAQVARYGVDRAVGGDAGSLPAMGCSAAGGAA